MCQTGSRKIAADGIGIDQLHYLNAECHFWVLIYTSMGIHVLAPTYQCEELRRPADTQARRRLRSASSTSLDVRRTRLSTVGDRAFPVAATAFHCTSLLPPLSLSSAVILNHISSHFLIPLPPSSLICVMLVQWLSFWTL